MRRAFLLLVFLVFAWSVAACGSDDGDSSTTTPAQDPTGGVIDVTFDGVACTSEGPSTIAPGEHSFLLIDNSERPRTEMWVASIADGHTYSELLELQDQAGGQGADGNRPSWVGSTPMIAPASSPAEGQMLYSHALEPGLHTFVVGGSDAQWNCGSFEVIGN